MNPGKLNKRITIQRQEKVVDENFITKMEYADYKTVWANTKTITDTETDASEEFVSTSKVQFYVRYSAIKDLDKKDRIVFGDKTYNIHSVDNLEFRNNYWKILATALEREI